MIIYHIVVFLAGLLFLITNVKGSFPLKIAVRLIGVYLSGHSLVILLEMFNL